jgi:hypothetical protein
VRDLRFMSLDGARPVRIPFHADYLWLGGLEKQGGKIVLGLERARFDEPARRGFGLAI